MGLMGSIRSFIAKGRSGFMNMALTGKMLVIYLLAVLCPTLLLITIFYESNLRGLEQTYYENQEKSILYAKENLTVSLNQIAAASNYYQNSETLIELLNGAYPDVSNTLFYYIRDVVPLIQATRVNPNIQEVYIYGYKEYAVNMEKGLVSASRFDRGEEFLNKVRSGKEVWEFTFDKDEEPQLRYYRDIYINSYPYDIGILMFDLKFQDILKSFSEQVEWSFFLQQSDGTLAGYENETFVRYEGVPEVLEDTSNHSYTLALSDGFPQILVSIPPMEKPGRQSSLLGLSIMVLILVFTVFYFLFNFSIAGRLRNFAAHLRTANEEELLPFEDNGYQDEVGVAITSYNELVARTNSLINENLKAQIQRRESDYYALQAQIRPHFLYNVLENIRMSAETNRDPVTADMLLALGKHMRYSLNTSPKPVALEEELYSAKNYLQIYKIRLKDKIQYKVLMAAEIEDVYCPRFLLQPLLENALNHGFRLDRPLNIQVMVSEGEEWGRKDCVRVCIEDDGNGIPEEKLAKLQQKLKCREVEQSNHVGLLNVNSRLASYQGSESGCIFLESREGEGTRLCFYLYRRYIYTAP